MESLESALKNWAAEAQLLIPDRMEEIISDKMEKMTSTPDQREILEDNPERLEEVMRAAAIATGDVCLSDEEGRRIMERMKRFLFRNETVLELGCGPGWILKHLAPHCRYLYGSDSSEQKLALASLWLQGITNVELLHRNGHLLRRLANGQIDFAYCLFRLQQTEKRDAFLQLKELFRVLRGGGRALLSFPNLTSDTFFRDIAHDFLVPRAEGSVGGPQAYTKEEVSRIVESIGFSVSDLWADDFVNVHLKKITELFPDRLIMGRNDAAVLDITGWYGLEENGSVLFRWTGKSASFFLMIDPTKTVLKVELSCRHPEVARMGLTLSLYQDGNEASSVKIQNEGMQEHTFTIRRTIKEEIVHFALEVDWTFMAIGDTQWGGSRALGVAVFSIKAV